MSKLLDLEQQAEVESAENSLDAEAPSARDRVLPHLRLSDVETGLLGRSLLTLVNNKSGGQLPLPPHRITPNDIVRLRLDKSPAGSASLCEGVVYRVRDDSLVIAVDDVPDNGLDVPLRLEKLANKVTYTRMNAALQALEETATHGGSPIIDVCFGRTVPCSFTAQITNNKKLPIQWYNPHLDAAQQRGVKSGLQTNDVALIHGPPGTGKTTAVVELVLQEMARGGRVLVCAASNIAVDNLVERLAKHQGSLGRNWLIRAGHPARLLPQVLDHSLEARVLDSDSSALAKDCRREMRQLNQRLVRLQGKREEGAMRRQLRRELKSLAKEERKRQEGAVAEVLRSALVLCCTLTGLDGRQLSKALNQTNGDKDGLFDLVIIDEAAQALEPACWAALLRGRRAVLVGDHLQLPPTITSQRAADGGLARTLFERLQMMYTGGKITTMLTVQYRMHRDIMEWASEAMYQGRLEAAPSVAEHTLEDLKKSDEKDDAPPNGGEQPDDEGEIFDTAAASTTRGTGQSQRNKSRPRKKGARANNRNQSIAVATPSASTISDASQRLLRTVLLFIDTAGCDAAEQQDEESASIYNEREAAVVLAHARRLVSAGVKPGSIGIITPYAAQAALLKQSRPAAWAPALEVSTVDGFQGREKEAIIISCVRSSDAGGVGFLADARRMNVAVTRARRHCALVGDSETLGRDEFLRVLISHFEQRGEYESGAELLDHQAIV